MNEQQNQTESQDNVKPQDQISVTQHTATIGGETIRYTVTTGTIILKEEPETWDEDEKPTDIEKPKASVFFVAYTRDDVDDKTKRPLTFSFNGGPGSSSVWLHLGVLGPKRVKMADDGALPPPPFELVENEFSLLDHTDLVFIDPVSTGYSRSVAGEKAGDYHNFKKDIQSVGDFIRLYSTRYKRWTSPKFLIGESYGTTRAAGLSGYLQERHGMFLNGVMLVSCILNFLTARFGPGNDAPYILFLPTYAATAWYHGKVKDKWKDDLEGFLKEVEAFAAGKYAAGLFQGDALPEKERASLARKLSEYTGLSQTYIEQTNLRIDIQRFTKELMRDEHRTVGRLDSRFKGIDRDAAGEYVEFDPSMMDILGPYTATMYDYVRNELGFESDIPYEILSFKVNQNWRYDSHENQYVNVAETLRRAISINPYLKVFVANGYYDLATPYFATIHTFNHLGLDKSLRDNISMGFYEAGHMMYVHMDSLKKLKQDLAKFVSDAVPS